MTKKKPAGVLPEITAALLGEILAQELEPFGMIEPDDLRVPSQVPWPGMEVSLHEALDRAGKRIYEYLTRGF